VIVGNRADLTFAAQGLQQAFGPNPRRVGLIVGAPTASSAYLSIGQDASNLGGLRLNSGVLPPWQILFPAPNDWITQPVTVFAQAALTINLYELVDRAP
jgi:hypothetical protein